jgi:hypothetical protein
MGIYMSTLTQFLPQTGIKSVQRGTFVIGVTDFSGTASINSVTTGKSFVNFLGLSLLDTSVAAGRLRLELTDSTTVTANRASVGSQVNSVTVSYEVVEFN